MLSKKPPLQTYPAFYAALAEAEQIIKAEKPAAAKAYIRVEQSKLPLDLVEKIVQDPESTSPSCRSVPLSMPINCRNWAY
ncbi:hypothetical protein HDC32_000941 [Pseudomonas sp. JAI120]|nr:hypothetical protein [Pseudomonas sp. SJZ073]MBB6311272.1 hypothetical protein [Pseudomonas sp. JAI120]